MSINTFVYQGIFSFWFFLLRRIRYGFLSPALLYVLLTSSVSGYFSAAVNRGLVMLALRGEVSQAPADILLPSGRNHIRFAFVLAGYQSRRTLIHIPESSSS